MFWHTRDGRSAQQKPPVGVGLDMSHPLNRGIVGCWLFNEGSGRRGSDLSATGAGVLIGKWARNAIVLNGTTDYVDVPFVASRSTVLVTVTPLALPDYSELVGWGHSSISNAAELRFATAAVQYGEYDGSWTAMTSNAVAAIGTRIHVAMTRTVARLITLYANGRFLTSGSVLRSPTLNQTSIGALPWLGGRGYLLTAAVESVAVYSRVLSAAEIAQLYAEPYAPEMFEPLQPPRTYIIPGSVRPQRMPVDGSPFGQRIA